MRILLTGALGYIGSRVACELSRHHVIPVDNFSSSKTESIAGERIARADIKDLDFLASLDFDQVIHLAAVSGVEECEKDPKEAYMTNVIGTQNLAYLCHRKKVPLIFACSQAIFGAPCFFPINESHPRAPLNLYGLTKLLGEESIKIFSKGSFPSFIFVIANAYGFHEIEGQRIENRNVISKFVEAARNERPLTVHRPGSQARNFIHVQDIARAFTIASDIIEKGKNESRVYNLAHESFSVMRIAEMVKKIGGEHGFSPRIELVDNPRKEAISEDFSVDTKRIKSELGFSPQIPLERTIEEMFST